MPPPLSLAAKFAAACFWTVAPCGALSRGRHLKPELAQDEARTRLAESSPFSLSDFAKAASKTHKEHCAILASRGMCAAQRLWPGYRRGDMSEFCPGACEYASRDRSLLEANREWSQMSLYDYQRYNPAHCPSQSAPEPLPPREDPCSDLENMAH